MRQPRTRRSHKIKMSRDLGPYTRSGTIAEMITQDERVASRGAAYVNPVTTRGE